MKDCKSIYKKAMQEVPIFLFIEFDENIDDFIKEPPYSFWTWIEATTVYDDKKRYMRGFANLEGWLEFFKENVECFPKIGETMINNLEKELYKKE